jgi:hypothetical protein
MVPVLDITATVVNTDSMPSSDLKATLRVAVSALENIADKHKNWQLGTDGKIFNLVDPSLFPLIYGCSRILPRGTVSLNDCLNRIGESETIPGIEVAPSIEVFGDRYESKTHYVWSKNFQWLPCNVSFLDGENAKIESYINNLHHKDYRNLYGVLEKLITRVIPSGT